MRLFMIAWIDMRRSVAAKSSLAGVVARENVTVLFFKPLFRNRIKSEPPRKRMASQQSLQPQPAPAGHAKAFNRFICELRTGGLVAATSREQQRQVRFVKSQREEGRAHRVGCRCRRATSGHTAGVHGLLR